MRRGLVIFSARYPSTGQSRRQKFGTPLRRPNQLPLTFSRLTASYRKVSASNSSAA